MNKYRVIQSELIGSPIQMHWTTCPRCGGTGTAQEDGPDEFCYLCQGHRKVWLDEASGITLAPWSDSERIWNEV